jgi:hypothetical protein
MGSIITETGFMEDCNLIINLGMKIASLPSIKVNQELKSVLENQERRHLLHSLKERNDFEQLVYYLSELLTDVPEEDDCSDEGAERYKSYYMLDEGKVELNPTPLILDGDCRIEILGMNLVDKAGKQNVGNYNGYFVYWKVLPNDGEKL